MADDITKKLDEMRRRAMESLHEARAILSQMNVVETLFDLPLTTLKDLETSAVGAASVPLSAILGTDSRSQVQQPMKRSSVAQIRPDEYFGDEPMEAAKKFMRSVGHAVAFDEIAEAVQKGGAVVKGADWRDRLELSLKRSPYQVITVAEKTYGLAEFYTEEQLKRFRGRGNPTAPTQKKKTKGKGGWPKGKPRGKKVQKADDGSKEKKGEQTSPSEAAAEQIH
jgi:hypothetical protein